MGLTLFNLNMHSLCSLSMVVIPTCLLKEFAFIQSESSTIGINEISNEL